GFLWADRSVGRLHLAGLNSVGMSLVIAASLIQIPRKINRLKLSKWRACCRRRFLVDFHLGRVLYEHIDSEDSAAALAAEEPKF
ncbi:MAG: hypothetical protein QF916_09660, partial [Gammaproteobacteria bacterium]|nr:hypothetical protein [Gammaproteobacteria bacterium]